MSPEVGALQKQNNSGSETGKKSPKNIVQLD
jgi:hypothetical protein